MLANMACSLLSTNVLILQLLGKSAKQFVEPLITKSKADTTHNRHRFLLTCVVNMLLLIYSEMLLQK
jgi:ribosomal protein L17